MVEKKRLVHFPISGDVSTALLSIVRIAAEYTNDLAGGRSSIQRLQEIVPVDDCLAEELLQGKVAASVQGLELQLAVSMEQANRLGLT